MIFVVVVSFLDKSYYGNLVRDYGVALGIALGLILAAQVFRLVLLRRLRRLADQTDTKVDDGLVYMVERTRQWTVLVVALYLGSLRLELSPELTSAARVIAVIAALFQVGLWAGGGIRFATASYRHRKELEGDTSSVGTVSLMSIVGRSVIWALIVLLVLGNLGVNVTALVAGLGIGGIAVALALQNILADLFASVSIMLDKPFEVGDLVVVGEAQGHVENIGIKTTRIRSLDGEQLVYANSELLRMKISNYHRLSERRALFSIGVTYQTPAAVLETIPSLLEKIVVAADNARFDRAHFKSFGDSALLFEVAYYVTAADYRTFMDVQQGINFAIVREFESCAIALAYPTHSVFVTQVAPVPAGGA